ncbi:MAG: DUF4430 domain-containing protein [Candidatus Kerfeldbacteria bacterium]|nr:DUF4430 domain-containing protein [Candidatus Kerfeldbacteria bacterium]
MPYYSRKLLLYCLLILSMGASCVQKTDPPSDLQTLNNEPNSPPVVEEGADTVDQTVGVAAAPEAVETIHEDVAETPPTNEVTTDTTGELLAVNTNETPAIEEPPPETTQEPESPPEEEQTAQESPPTEEQEEVKQVSVALQVIQPTGTTESYSVKVDTGSTVETVMQAARDDGFTYSVKKFGSMGAYVESISGLEEDGGMYWIYYVNGTKSTAGISTQTVKKGDTISWHYEHEY